MKEPDVLPDTRHKMGGKFYKSMWHIPVYCANCHVRGPYVPEDNMNFAFWLCNDCYETHGTIAGTMVMPDEVFWAKVNERPIQIPGA